jgi:hypothetical protein
VDWNKVGDPHFYWAEARKECGAGIGVFPVTWNQLDIAIVDGRQNVKNLAGRFDPASEWA